MSFIDTSSESTSPGIEVSGPTIDCRGAKVRPCSPLVAVRSLNDLIGRTPEPIANRQEIKAIEEELGSIKDEDARCKREQEIDENSGRIMEVHEHAAHATLCIANVRFPSSTASLVNSSNWRATRRSKTLGAFVPSVTICARLASLCSVLSANSDVQSHDEA